MNMQYDERTGSGEVEGQVGEVGSGGNSIPGRTGVSTCQDLVGRVSVPAIARPRSAAPPVTAAPLEESRPGAPSGAALPEPERLEAAPTVKVPRKGSRSAKAAGNGEVRGEAGRDAALKRRLPAQGNAGPGDAGGSSGAGSADGVAQSSLLWALIAAEGESTQVARDAGLRLSEARALLNDTAQVQRIRRLRAAGAAIAQSELALMARAVFAELLLSSRGGSDLAALIRVFDKLPGAGVAGSTDEALLDEISGLSLDEAVAKARRLLSEIDAAEAVQ